MVSQHDNSADELDSADQRGLSSEIASENSVVHRAVWQALAELPANERQPIALAFFKGMTYRAVAEHLGLPESTVKSRIRRGMQVLTQALEQYR
jgi:RNA polymerase sigma factor (sigma-70 family)